MTKQGNQEKAIEAEGKKEKKEFSFSKMLIITMLLAITLASVWIFAGDIIITKTENLINVAQEKQEPLYVALAIPFEENDGISRDLLGGIELCKEDYQDLNVEFIPFYDERNPAKAREIANEIVKSKALVVIGHYTSGASKVAGEIYKEAGIAAITGTSTADDVTRGNDWYFRTVFTNQEQARFLAYYIKNVRNVDTVHIISQSPDAYSVNMHANFYQYYQELGGTVLYNGVLKLDDTLSGNEKKVQVEAELQRVIKDIPLGNEGADAEFIVLVMQRDVDVYAVRMLKDAHINIPFFGTDSMGSDGFIEDFRTAFPDIKDVNTYTNGIVAVVPMIFDVASGDAQLFYDRFYNKYNFLASWEAATFYDATCAALKAIETAKITASSAPEQIEQDRIKVRDNLKKSIGEGLSGKISFDTEGNIQEPAVIVGMFDNAHFISHPVQLRLTNPPREYQVVYTGMKVDEITNIDIRNSTFSASFYLWFLSSKPGNGDLDIEFLNAVREISLGKPLQQGKIDDLYYRSYFVTGDFKANLNFRKYPFDEQELEIRFRNKGVTNNELVYVIDYLEKQAIPPEAIQSNSGWVLIEARSGYAHESVRFDNSWGSRGGAGQYNSEHSVITATAVLGRDAFKFGLKNMLPVILVSIITYLSFFLGPKHLSTIRTVVTGSLLTTAFIHSGALNNLPPINYFTVLDIMFYILYGVILVEVIIIIFAQRAYDNNEERKAMRFFTIARIFYPAVFISMLIWLTQTVL